MATVAVRTTSGVAATGAAVSFPAFISSGAAKTLTGRTQHFTELPSHEGLDDGVACRVLECGQWAAVFCNGQCSADAFIAWPQYARHRMAPAFMQRNAITNREISLVFIRLSCINDAPLEHSFGAKSIEFASS